MAIEAEMADGRILEFPDGTDPSVIQATVKRMLGQPSGPTAAGVAAEGAKGLFRGAGNTAKLIAEGVTRILPEPVGRAARAGMKALSDPSVDLVAPDPQNNLEQMASTGGEIAGAALAGGPAGTVRQTAMNALLPAAGGVIGEQVAGETGKLVGSLAPTAAQLAVAPLANAASKKVSQTLETFRKAGTAPTVGQATESSFIRGLENLIAKFPGGVGVMRNFANQQQAALGASRTGVSADTAGRAIEKGVTGSGGFLERSKAVWQQLDDQVAARIPSSSGIKPENTLQALDELTRPIKGAELTSRVMSTPKVAEIRQAMTSDMAGKPPERVIALLGADGKEISRVPVGGAPGTEVMPFQALRELRSKVGAMLDDALVSGIPGGELKKLYGALSKDMEAAAKSAGAGEAFARQNNFYRSRMERIESVLERVIGKGKQPEDIFKSFFPTDPDQAGKVRAVMRSLEPAQRQVVSEAVVNRLGRATPGKQDEIGEVFSSETFLTNWNRLSEGAKQQLFPNHSMRSHINAIAKVSSNIREGSKTFANPSGTAGAVAPYGLGVLTGFGQIGVVGGLIGSAYVGAKMLTSPKVVEWLARTPNVTPGNAAQHFARLGTIYNQTGDQGLKQELEEYVQKLQE